MAERQAGVTELADAGVTRVPATRSVGFRLTWNRDDIAADSSSSPDSSGSPDSTTSSDGSVEVVDLDLGCFYWTTDGRRGALQSVGGSGTGSRSVDNVDGQTLLRLSSDEVEGGGDGEELVVERPGDLSFLVLHTSIYRGAADFRDVGARVSVRSGERLVAELALSSPAPGLDWCAALVLGAAGARLHLAHEERYFRSAFHADRHYGLGLRWEMGRKSG